MRSKYVDKFNHDEDASGYDRDVRNEDHPIRAGYSRLLDWIGGQLDALQASTVLDLGSGTGNLGLRLREYGLLVCVDVSAEMTARAKAKFAGRENVRFVSADLLEFFDTSGESFDAVVSSYAIHHLTEPEKMRLFERIAACLRPSGVAVLGDLMFENTEARDRLLETYRAAGRGALVDDIEDEFFWDLASATRKLTSLGFAVETRRFSDLSWGIAARRT